MVFKTQRGDKSFSLWKESGLWCQEGLESDKKNPTTKTMTVPLTFPVRTSRDCIRCDAGVMKSCFLGLALLQMHAVLPGAFRKTQPFPGHLGSCFDSVWHSMSLLLAGYRFVRWKRLWQHPQFQGNLHRNLSLRACVIAVSLPGFFLGIKQGSRLGWEYDILNLVCIKPLY